MSVSAKTERIVRDRARGRCEYCMMHQSLQGASFHCEHIVPESRAGGSEPDNLAMACPSCNFRKSDRVEAVDPSTGQAVRLYHPRLDRWSDHFDWDDCEIVGLSPIGRATIDALNLNHPRRRQIREAERRFDLFPPNEEFG